ncbi:SipW-cognate class signal peptide [Acetitomaculum ruminis DSM 5522]|uniref:SipW-cognate class signal peptide n=1 Tax=Acetitomaculum ruminis DSM 5522 TaxID=1120918 RepID=A0A1I0XS50_9FIRM|nr:SipW-dependent-type signal peptide-containing protein [Acetitomaculum ruminis]SFB03008.1 SipW-cognate class signal peptide [Acetitomaculum ruminis DSM 5522]
MKKRKLIKLFGAMVVLAVVGVGSTLAYLSDRTDTLTNVFTVGDVELQLRESNVYHVEESGYIDADFEYTWDVDSSTQNPNVNNGVDYSDCAPGDIILKDPTVFANATVKSLIYVYLKNIEVVDADTGKVQTKAIKSTDKSLQFTLHRDWEIYEANAKDGIIIKYKTQDGDKFNWYDSSEDTGDYMPVFEEYRWFLGSYEYYTTEIPSDSERGATYQDLDVQALGVQAKYVSGDATVERQIIKENTDWLN